MPERDPTENPSGNPETIGHDGIDAALAQATELASQLTHEVGEPDGVSPQAQATTELAPDSAGSPGHIESQIEQVEGLLERAEVELGADRPTAAAPPDDSSPTLTWSPTDDPSVSGLAADASLPDLSEGGESRGNAHAGPAAAQQHEPGGAPASAGTPAGPANPTMGRTARIVCTTLDLLDRPFARVSYPARQIIGVAALVTFIVAIVTFALANL